MATASGAGAGAFSSTQHLEALREYLFNHKNEAGAGFASDERVELDPGASLHSFWETYQREVEQRVRQRVRKPTRTKLDRPPLVKLQQSSKPLVAPLSLSEPVVHTLQGNARVENKPFNPPAPVSSGPSAAELSLKRQVATLRKQLDESRMSATQMEEQLNQRLKDAHQELQETMHHADVTISALESKVAGVQAECDREVALAREALAAAQTDDGGEEVVQMRQQLQQMTAKLARAEAEGAEAQKRLEEAKQRLNNAQEETLRAQEDAAACRRSDEVKTGRVESLTADVSQAQARADSLAAELESERRAHVEVQRDLKSAKEQVASLQAGADSSADARVISLEAQTKELRSRLGNKERTLTEAREELQKSRSAIAEAKERSDQELSRMREQAERKQAELKSWKLASEQESARLKAEQERHRARASELELSVDKLRRELQSSQDSEAALEARAAEASDLSETVESLRSERDELRERVEQQEQELVIQRRDSGDLAKVQQGLQKWKEQYEAATSEAEETRREHDSLVEQLRDELEEHRHSKSQLEAKLRDVEEQLESATSRSKREELEQLAFEAEKARERSAELEEMHHKVVAELAEIKVSHEQAMNQVEKLRAAEERSQKLLANARDEARDLESQLSQVNMELRILKQEAQRHSQNPEEDGPPLPQRRQKPQQWTPNNASPIANSFDLENSFDDSMISEHAASEASPALPPRQGHKSRGGGESGGVAAKFLAFQARQEQGLKEAVVNEEDEDEDEDGNSDDDDDDDDDGDDDDDEEEKTGWEIIPHGDKFYYWHWDTGTAVWTRPEGVDFIAGEDPADAAAAKASASASSSGQGSASAKKKANKGTRKSSERDEAQARAFEQELIDGIVVRKFPFNSRFNSKPSSRVLWYEPSRKTIYWQKGEKNPAKVKSDARLKIADIVEVSRGRKTSYLKRHGSDSKSKLYWSLVSRGETRTLDVEAASVEERRRLVQQFKNFLRQYR